MLPINCSGAGFLPSTVCHLSFLILNSWTSFLVGECSDTYFMTYERIPNYWVVCSSPMNIGSCLSKVTVVVYVVKVIQCGIPSMKMNQVFPHCHDQGVDMPYCACKQKKQPTTESFLDHRINWINVLKPSLNSVYRFFFKNDTHL